MTQSQDRSRHFDFIDGVRGIAACLVMLQHGMEGLGIERLGPGHFANSWFNLGETGVVAFFFVSGFVIPLSLEKWNNIPHFWINRVFRIYPMYMALYLFGAMWFVMSGHTFHNVPLNFIGHLFFVQEFLHTPNFIGVAWTLSLEAVWYLLFSILFWLGWNDRNGLVSALAIAAAVAACLLSLFVLRLPMGRVGLLLVCFLGLLCLRREYGQIGHSAFSKLCLAIGVTILACLLTGFWLRPAVLSPLTVSVRCTLISWALGAVIFLTAYFWRSCTVFQNWMIRYLGKISYSIYLLHGTVIMLMVPVFREVFRGLPGESYFALAGGMTGTIVVASLTYRYIERPAIRLSHALRPPKLSTVISG